MTKEQERTITWFQFNNVFPIITTAIMLASSFFLLQSKVALLEQKLDFIIETQKDNNTIVSGLQIQISANTLDIREIQTEMKNQ